MNSLKEQENITPTDFLRVAANKDLIPFCITTDDKYQDNWHHVVIAEKLENALEKLEHGQSSFIVIEMPPRHGKSELASIKFPAWALGKHPEWPVILASYAADLAQDFGQRTRDVMVEPNYGKIFDTRLREDTKAKGKWLTSEGGGYTACGIGGPITGKGGKILIVDDPFKNRQEADSLVMREAAWKWYTSTFYTRREGACIIIVICTRWHLDDLVGRIEEREAELEKAGLPHDEWEYISFPALADEQEVYRSKGDALWPWKFNKEELAKIKNAIGISEWASLYQQTPIITENQEFKKEYFRYFEQQDVASKTLNINILVDPAISEKKEACNTAITAVGKEKENPDWFILDYIADKLDPGALIEGVFKVYLDCRQLYKNANIRVCVESIAYQKALLYFFGEEMKKRQIYFNVVEIKSQGEKEERIRGLIPLWKLGLIHHRHWMTELEKEALEFPKGKMVDILDSISFNLQIAENTAKANKTRKPPPHQPTSRLAGI